MQYEKYQLESLYKVAPVTWVASFINAVILAVVLSYEISHDAIAQWFIAFISIFAVRLFIHLQYRAQLKQKNKIDTRVWVSLFSFSSLVGGLTWGLAPILMFPHNSPLHQAFLIFVLVGMASAGAVTLSPMRNAYFSFVLAVIVPIFAVLAVNATEMAHYAMAFMSFLFGAIILYTCKQSNAKVKQIFELTAEKEFFLKQADEALKQADEANRAKSQFLANISHEIRTPLNAVIGISQLVAQTKLNAKQSEYMGLIERSAGTLLSLINDILDISKIESHRLEIEVIPVNLKEIVSDICEVFKPVAEQKGLELLWDMPEEISEIKTDPVRIQQIFNNILSNAIKFTDTGSVHISIDILKETRKHLNLMIKITDTGIGIPKDLQSKIFRPFSQANSSTTRKYGGTGLGLSICKELIERLQGTISLISKPNKGSTFIIKVPFEKTETSVKDKNITKEKELKKDKEVEKEVVAPVFETTPIKILVAEDNETNQLVLTAFLQKYGYIADVACNGQEAVSMSAKEKYDLILMDLDMPVMDGFEATEKIFSRDKKSSPTIVALTANIIPKTIKKCLDLGMMAHIGKPFTPGDIFDVIQKVYKDTVS